MSEKKIQELRQSIDLLDNALVNLIAERLRASQRVWEAKQEAGMPSHDPKRWEEVLESKRKIAKSVGVDPKLIEDLMNTIHDHILANR